MPQDGELHKAAHLGDAGKVSSLLAESACEVAAPGASLRTALHRAVGAGHEGVAIQLLEAGAPIDAVDAYARTPLHWATMGKHGACVALLAERGCAVNAQMAGGHTALHDAAEECALEVVKLLLFKGAAAIDTELKDEEQKTALDLVVEKAQLKPPKEGALTVAGYIQRGPLRTQEDFDAPPPPDPSKACAIM